MTHFFRQRFGVFFWFWFRLFYTAITSKIRHFLLMNWKMPSSLILIFLSNGSEDFWLESCWITSSFCCNIWTNEDSRLRRAATSHFVALKCGSCCWNSGISVTSFVCLCLHDLLLQLAHLCVEPLAWVITVSIRNGVVRMGPERRDARATATSSRIRTKQFWNVYRLDDKMKYFNSQWCNHLCTCCCCWS